MIEDFKSIHAHWMDILYDRYSDPHPVLGSETPETKTGRALKGTWFTIGVVLSIILYPIVLTGLILRFVIIKKLNRFISNNGMLVALVSVFILWFSLIGISYHIEGIETATAMAVASTITFASSVVSYFSRKIGGRLSTILLSYPLAYTAILLPPITFSIIHSGYGQELLLLTEEAVHWFQDVASRQLDLGRSVPKDLVKYGHIAPWVIVSFVLGSITGLIVSISRLLK